MTDVERWYCARPAVRTAQWGDGPLPEAEKCSHAECRLTEPQVPLSAEPLTVESLAARIAQRSREIADVADKIAKAGDVDG